MEGGVLKYATASVPSDENGHLSFPSITVFGRGGEGREAASELCPCLTTHTGTRWYDGILY